MEVYVAKKLLAIFIGLLSSLVIAEIIMGYVLFQRDLKSGKSALLRAVIRVSTEIPGASNTTKQLVRINYLHRDSSTENPFLSYSSQDGYKYHPFIDHTNVFSLSDESGVPIKISRDYFGFRNHEDLYFSRGPYDLIVITGGSEAAGVSHQKSIAEHLELLLNTESGRKYRVLNLGMNSYTVASEINAFINLAYNLHPKYVISHTSWNDVLYSLMVPKKFKELGLNYVKTHEEWLPRLYDLKKTQDRPWRLNEDGADMIVPALIKQYAKYKKIVKSNGGEFILGLQAYNREWDIAKTDHNHNMQMIYERTRELLRQLATTLPESQAIAFQVYSDKLRFVDSIHTDDASARFIARVYADRILANEKLTPHVRH